MDADHPLSPEAIHPWADRLLASQKLQPGSPYLHGEPMPTRNQVAALLHALADHTAIVHMLQVAPEIGVDRASLGDEWARAMGVGRFLQGLGNAIEMGEDLDGATEPGEPMAYPSGAGEFAARFNARSTEEREKFVAVLVEQSERSMRCLEENHVHRLAARERDSKHLEFIPENVLDAAFASQKEWWTPGDDGARPVIQFEQQGEDATVVKHVTIASLIETVADATYKATITEIGVPT